MTRIHLSFPTADLSAATAFYTSLFDAAPDKVHDDLVRFQPPGVPVSLSLVQGHPAATAVHQGIKLTTVEEVQAARARLADAGLQMRHESTGCCYADLDRIWVHDPDGRPWEVYTVLDDQGTQLAPQTGTCCGQESSCC